MDYADSHVHLRDGLKQSHKETIKHGLEVARDTGVVAVFDMPNTDPAIMTRDLVEQRLRLARDANIPEVFYGLYVGLTSNREQVKQAVQICRDFFPHVVGMKLYAGHSVGNLGVTLLEEQEIVYETLSREGYQGILAVHAEKEDKINSSLFNSLKPKTHCTHARPEIAEIESVRDQITLATNYKFPGKLHIAHISSPGAVALVQEAKKAGLDISCGICPHHFIYDWDMMAEKEGILWKMNPPLRSPESRAKMFKSLLIGEIDWIETDHAPHSLKEKSEDPFMSGIPGLPWFGLFEEYLRRNEFPDSRIKQVLLEEMIKRFGIKFPKSKAKRIDRTKDYPLNAYKPIEILLNWRQ